MEVESSAEQGFKLTAEALRKVITPRSKLLMVNFPTNPTGAVMTYEDWLPIAQIVKRITYWSFQMKFMPSLRMTVSMSASPLFPGCWKGRL